jgi:glycosyltransferase involved in cell wall biosynthesis
VSAHVPVTGQTRVERPDLIVSAPYPENAAMAIAHEAAQQGRLVAVYGSSAPGWVLSLDGMRRHRRAAANKFVAKGVPGSLFVPTLQGAEVLRLLAKAAALHPRVNIGIMRRQQRWFDARVASRILVRDRTDAVVGLPVASLDTFKAARSAGALCVLHFVNSHPRVQNELLATQCGLPPTHHEMIPEWVARRVEDEIALADLILLPSEFVMQQFASRGVNQPKTVLLPYGVEPDSFAPGSIAGGPHNPIRVLFAGQIAHRKGVRLLVETMRFMGRSARAALYGVMVSPEVLTGAPENMIWCGSRSTPELAAAMRTSDVLVLPSIEDSSGLVVTEALASGLPVVTTTTTGASRFVTPGVNGYVLEAPDPKTLADALWSASRLPRPVPMPTTCSTWRAYGEALLNLVDERSAMAAPGRRAPSARA